MTIEYETADVLPPPHPRSLSVARPQMQHFLTVPSLSAYIDQDACCPPALD